MKRGRIGVAIGILFALIGTVFMGVWASFPDASILKTAYPIVHYTRADAPPDVTLQRLRPSTWTGLAEISKPARQAIIISEDWAFYQHGGFDTHQIQQAIKEDWAAKGFARGASTITQQVARNVFLSKDKNLWRKIKELYLAVQLEKSVGKRKILETYFNVAEWGEGIYGVGAAAEFYFHKSPSALTAKEGAFLAMLLPSPIRYGQSFRAKHLTEYADETIRSILSKMEQAHFLTHEEREVAENSPLSFLDR